MTTPFRSAVAAVALIAATGSACAMAEYRVWYNDDINYTYDYGDIASGNSQPMVPPSWACGRRFFDPSYYRFRGHYFEILKSGDFYSDIHVWLPLGGACPYDQIRVEKKNGTATYVPPSGTHLLSIHSHFGGYWIDASGGWPACNCQLPKAYLTLARSQAPWGTIDTTFGDAVRQPAGGGLRLLDQAMSLLATLRQDLAKAVSDRRGSALGKLESTVRRLEDQALSSAAMAAEQAQECGRWLSVGAADSAHRACTQAAESVQLARGAMAVVASELHQ